MCGTFHLAYKMLFRLTVFLCVYLYTYYIWTYVYDPFLALPSSHLFYRLNIICLLSSIWTHIWVISRFWILWINLLWIFVFKSFIVTCSHFSGYLGYDCQQVLLLVFNDSCSAATFCCVVNLYFLNT